MFVQPRSLAIGVVLLLSPSPVAAQWTRVPQLPATEIASVWVNGDTIAASGDSVAYLSTDAGATWKSTAKLAAGVTSVQAVRLHHHRLYAGTYGKGMFTSDDLGDTWTAYNQGLVGGIANAQLYIVDLVVRGDSLYAATSGAGAWVRNIAGAGTWSHYGDAFEPNQASNMNAIAASPVRLIGAAGFNGTVFFRDRGQPDWTLSWLDNTGIVPGLAALSAHWTGSAWLVGSNVGVFRNPIGQSPWSFFDPGFGTLFTVSFAQRGTDLFACYGPGGSSTISYSADDGVTWQEVETLPATFTFNIAMAGDVLYMARTNGLWRRTIGNVAVPPAADPSRLLFALAGAQPVRDDVRFRFNLPEAGRAAIDVFDVTGRRAAAPIEGRWPAGPHEVVWSARDLAPGVYLARLSAAGRTASVHLVRVR